MTQRARIRLYLLLLLLLIMGGILLTACFSAGGSVGIDGLQATISYAQGQTRMAASAQEATAVAVVTEQAIVDADMTRTFAVATLERAQKLDTVEDQRIDIEIENRRSALAAADQLNQQIVADNQRRLDQAAAEREREAAAKHARSIVLIVLMGLLGLVGILLLVAAIVDRLHRMSRREEALRALKGQQAAPAAPQITAADSARQPRLTVSGPPDPQTRVASLPPRQRTALLQQSVAALEGQVANWDEFARWNKPDQMVIGVGVNGPITLDLALLPHLFIAGATRKGKSTLVRVLLSYLATNGFNVVILNERSSDFAALADMPNVLNLRGFSASQRLRLAQDAFAGAVEEMNRRDEILHAAAVPTWREYLRNNPRETPLTFIFVDEFLELAQGNRQAQDALMRDALTIASQAGKFGIGIGLNATDPTQRALGEVGYTVAQNCARVGLGLNSTYASMSLFGDDSAFGLPAGRFVVIDHEGQRHAGVGFNPRPAQLASYLEQRQPTVVRPFPVALTAVSRSLTTEETQPDLDTTDPELSRVIEDSQLISTILDSAAIGRATDSRSAICETLYELGHIGWGRTGPNVRRVELSLNYLASKGNQRAAAILAKSRSTSLTQDDAQLVGRIRAAEPVAAPVAN